MQLEPVVSTLHTTQQALRRHYRVDETWVPERTSAQVLGDRVTPVGTWLPGPDGHQVWVGAPLRVHRRCEEPMFGFVNQLAYDGMMLNATEQEPALDVERTVWVDVDSPISEGNWIPAEGEAAVQIIDYLLREDLEDSNIFVISPFRQAAGALVAILSRKYPGLKAGTVHTAQGQQREVVLLVLGGNPDRPGARSWAAERPNLVNVAVSRAKQRLYVVGNHAAWSGLPSFDLLARSIPVRRWTPIDRNRREPIDRNRREPINRSPQMHFSDRVQIPDNVREQLAGDQGSPELVGSRIGAEERLAGMEERELAARWAATSGRDIPSADTNPASAADTAAAVRRATEAAEQEARRRETARREDDSRRREQGRGPHR
jgi:hypothetical protein